MPEELKPCPFCGCDLKKFPPEMIIMRSTSDAYVEWEIAHGLILGDSNQLLVMCERCGAKGQGGVTKEEAIKNWNRRTQQPNEPLTLEELREMDGEPVWVRRMGKDVECMVIGSVEWNAGEYYDFSDYGKTWLAYAHKPEEGEKG